MEKWESRELQYFDILANMEEKEKLRQVREWKIERKKVFWILVKQVCSR